MKIYLNDNFEVDKFDDELTYKGTTDYDYLSVFVTNYSLTQVDGLSVKYYAKLPDGDEIGAFGVNTSTAGETSREYKTAFSSYVNSQVGTTLITVELVITKGNKKSHKTIGAIKHQVFNAVKVSNDITIFTESEDDDAEDVILSMQDEIEDISIGLNSKAKLNDANQVITAKTVSVEKLETNEIDAEYLDIKNTNNNRLFKISLDSAGNKAYLYAKVGNTYIPINIYSLEASSFKADTISQLGTNGITFNSNVYFNQLVEFQNDVDIYGDVEIYNSDFTWSVEDDGDGAFKLNGYASDLTFDGEIFTFNGSGDFVVKGTSVFKSQYATQLHNTTMTGTATLNNKDIATTDVATNNANGLMSAEDKARLDTLVASFAQGNSNNVVDTIKEILTIFSNYPEGADLVSALGNKVDKVTGKGLSTCDFTPDLKAIVENVTSNLAGKVNKVDNKGLSTNDFTDSYKSRVDDIGDLTSLATTEKSTIVDAINSLVSATPSVAKATSEEIIGMRG